MTTKLTVLSDRMSTEIQRRRVHYAETGALEGGAGCRGVWEHRWTKCGGRRSHSAIVAGGVQ